MNILLTGATGFIGRNFLRFWNSENRNDKLILLSSKNIENFPCILHKNYTFQTDAFGALHIDAVILLGAYVEHGKEPEMVRKHLSSLENIDYLLQHLPNVPSKIVYCSSVAVYGFDSSVPYVKSEQICSEASVIDPTKRAYALSKYMGEKLVSEWCEEHNCACQIVRIGRTYGPHRRFLDFFGTLAQCVYEKRVFSVYAHPDQKWNITYVDNISKWLINSVYLQEQPGVINLTSSDTYTTLEILGMVKELYPSFEWVNVSSITPRGVDYIFDSSKREKYLGKEQWTFLGGGFRTIIDLMAE